MKTSEEIISREKYDIKTLCDIIALLRSEEGCPWDKEQTHSSIRRDFIEETYEAVDAIDKNDIPLLKEELGDVLLQIVFHAQIEREVGNFTFDDVVHDICRKLIYRHPHVFGNAVVENGNDVIKNWDALKKKEKSDRATVTDELKAVPTSLPALIKAQKIGKKAGKAGFDFKDANDAFLKITEEVEEVRAELDRDTIDNEKLSEEIGDLLLATTNLARFTHVDCEDALNSACNKFISRFEGVEKEIISIGKCVQNMSETELTSLWDAEKSKKVEKMP